MKGILKFDLDDANDAMSHKRCVKSLDLSLVIWELEHNFKKQCEWELETKTKLNKYDALDMLMEKFSELMEEHNIIIDELVL